MSITVTGSSFESASAPSGNSITFSGTQNGLSYSLTDANNTFTPQDPITYTLGGGASTNGIYLGYATINGVEYPVIQNGGGTTATYLGLGVTVVGLNVPETFAAGSYTCYVTGTRIRTAEGDVAVEELRVGDVAITRDGRQKAIRWIGRRSVRFDRHPNPAKVRPVRIRAGAFGEGLPYADLWLSPGHAVCLDNTLVPVRGLVDGDRVAIGDQDEVTYWHVELDGHDILLANGLPAESYLDTGNRRHFEGGEALQLHFDEDPAPCYDGTGYCLPLVESGPRLSEIRAKHLGAPSEREVASGTLRLAVDGVEISPCFTGENEVRFFLPTGAREVRLRSASFVGRTDVRRLGVLVGSVAVSEGEGWRKIDLDDASLFAGWHESEGNDTGVWRWTDGEGHISSEAWGGPRDGLMLRVTGVFGGFNVAAETLAA